MPSTDIKSPNKPIATTKSEQDHKSSEFVLATYKDIKKSEPIDLLPNVELKIEVYPPLTSQVPGIPITINFDNDKGNVANSYTIKLEATKGKLLDWDIETCYYL